MISQIYKNKKLLFLSFFFILCSIKFIYANKNEDNDYLYVYIESARQEYLGSYLDAAKLLHTCLKYDSTDYNVLYRLSKIYADAGSYKEALYFANKAYLYVEDNNWIGYNLIGILIETGNFERASEIINFQLTKNRDDVYLYRINAELLFKQKKYKDVIKKINEYDGKNKTLELIKIHCYNRLEKFNKSLELLNDLAFFYNEDNKILGVYAETLVKAKKYDEANEVYMKLLNNEPGNSLFWLSYFDYGLVAKDSLILNNFGKKILNSSKVKLSDKLYVIDRLKRIGINSLKNYADDQLYYLQNNFKEWNSDVQIMKDYLFNQYGEERAFNFLISLLKYNVKDEFYYKNLLYSIKYEQKDTLVKYSKLAYNNLPENPFFAWFYGMALKNKQLYQEALGIIKRFKISKIPNKNLRLEFYVLKAELLYHTEDFHNSFLNYESALLIDSSNELLLNNYSYYLSLQNKKLDYALTLIEKVIEQNKKNTIYLDTYAWILYKLERYNEALRIIDKAIKYEETPIAEIYVHKGDILYSLNKFKKCKNMWNKALLYESDPRDIIKIKEKLIDLNE